MCYETLSNYDGGPPDPSTKTGSVYTILTHLYHLSSPLFIPTIFE